MHKIPKTESRKVNDATWIYVKVCIKSQMLKLELNLAILGLLLASMSSSRSDVVTQLVCVFVHVFICVFLESVVHSF